MMDLLGLGAGMGSLLGTTSTYGGYVVGGILTFSFILVGIFITSKLQSGNVMPLFALMAVGFILSRAFGWFEDWALIAAVLFLVVGASGFFTAVTRRD